MLSKLSLPLLVLATTFSAIGALATNGWAAPNYKILHGFTGGSDGGGVWCSLTRGPSGNLYGTTSGGGQYGYGAAFQLKPQADGKWTERILHSFRNDKDGEGNGGLVLDTVCNVYGGTPVGGPHGNGTVFELLRETSGWKEILLNDFPQGELAAGPRDRLIMDSSGNLYGTGGSAYELSRTSDGWKFTNLHEFPSFNGDGVDPYAGLVIDSSGNLYGTTRRVGSHDVGIAYMLKRGSRGWTEHMLHSFDAFPNDGQEPGLGALALDKKQRLFGVTTQGGRFTCGNTGCGTIFMISPEAGGGWRETILYDFTGGANGSGPGGGVVLDTAGNLYGTTIYGGSGCDCGVVYKLAPQKNGKWKYTVLHTFVGSDGAQPDANLILDDKGNLHGTTATGGPGGYGVAFKLTP